MSTREVPTVDDNARAFARNMFRLRVHEADGQAYEDLFVRIMEYASPDFRPVKAHGNVGDKKNDGFDASTGTYYQVYAPEDIRKTQGDALAKLKEDFGGLKAFWDGIYPVKQYNFVINDKYQGVSPLIEKELAEIKAKHGLEKSSVLLAKHLEGILFKLSDDIVIAIVGHVPEIDAGEFLFLSGFTYFVGAWIDFEKAARGKLAGMAEARRAYGGKQLTTLLHSQGSINGDEASLIVQLADYRNPLIHGHSRDLPPKSLIDQLVLITDRLASRIQ